MKKLNSLSFKVDSVTVDLGYVTNAGFTRKRGLHTPHDDQFAVQVEVQMADHELSVNDATFEVYFGVKFGDIIVVSMCHQLPLFLKFGRKSFATPLE